jgi:protein gp37
LEEPLHWREPRRIFVNSMSDLFHENLPISDILRVFETMAAAKQHTFQILTKRPARMRYCLSYPDDRLVCESAEHHRLLCTMPLPNVWMGVSVEDQKTADERIPLLLWTPAVVRFVSLEPLLSSIDLSQWLRGLDWVIVGGESGNSARPFDITWARNVIRQCKHAGCACFVKQLGKHPYPGRLGNGRMPDLALRDGHGGEMTEWPEDLQVREFPGSAVARGTA